MSITDCVRCGPINGTEKVIRLTSDCLPWLFRFTNCNANKDWPMMMSLDAAAPPSRPASSPDLTRSADELGLHGCTRCRTPSPIRGRPLTRMTGCHLTYRAVLPPVAALVLFSTFGQLFLQAGELTALDWREHREHRVILCRRACVWIVFVLAVHNSRRRVSAKVARTRDCNVRAGSGDAFPLGILAGSPVGCFPGLVGRSHQLPTCPWPEGT